MTDHTDLISRLLSDEPPTNLELEAADALAALVKEREHHERIVASWIREEALWIEEFKEFNAALARVKRLEDALRGLLVDTQHLNHECCEEDCPVAYARAALAEGDKP